MNRTNRLLAKEIADLRKEVDALRAELATRSPTYLHPYALPNLTVPGPSPWHNWTPAIPLTCGGMAPQMGDY